MTQRWITKPLNEIGQVIRGVSFDKTEAYDAPADGLVPILRAGNISQELDVHNDLMWVPRKRVSDNQLMKVDDVAIAMSSGSADIVGKSAQLHETWIGSVGAFCAIVRFEREVEPRFGAYWMRSPAFAAWRSSQNLGANIKNLRKSDLENLLLPVPPLDEQHRIVSILDEAEGLRQLRARADERMADFIPALFNQMFGDPATNPKKWPVVPVSAFVDEFQGGRSILTDGAETEDTKYRILKVSAVTWGEYQPQESKPIPSDYEPLEHHFVRKGDLLFSRANTTALVGATVYVFDTPENIVLSDKLWRFVWHEPQLIDPLYVWALFLNQSIRRELGSRATGTGGSMKNISKPKVLSMPVPLPPLALQRDFAARVAEARALQDQQARSRVRLEGGFQALLHRAFNGEL